LPPEELASLGSKKICDPDRLRIFSTLKARAVNQLDKVGIRFLGGWAIPDDSTQSVLETLLSVKNEFFSAKEDFVNNYDLAVKSWVDKHPGWERLIEDSPVSAEQVRGRFAFNWQFYKVVPPDQNQVKDSLQNEVDNLGTTLFGEIAKEAQSVWNKVYAGKTEVSHKALSPLKTIRQKLLGLSFVEPTVAPIASLIEEALLSVPKRGLIKGQRLLILQGLVTTLKDPALLFEYGQKVLNGQAASDVLSFGLNSVDDGSEPDVETDYLDDMDEMDSRDDSSLPFDLLPDNGHDDQDGMDGLDNPLAYDYLHQGQKDDSVELKPLPDKENLERMDNQDNQDQKIPMLDSLGLW
jgi:hypothetical protein